MTNLKLGQRIKLKSCDDTFVVYEGPVVYINEENGWFGISAEVAYRTPYGIADRGAINSRQIVEPFRVSGWLSKLENVENV